MSTVEPATGNAGLTRTRENLSKAEDLVNKLEAAVETARGNGTSLMNLGELLVALRDAKDMQCRAVDQYQAAGGRLGT